MKKCPACEREFPDSLSFCGIDGTPLVPVFSIQYGGAPTKSYPEFPNKAEEIPPTQEPDPIPAAVPPPVFKPLEPPVQPRPDAPRPATPRPAPPPPAPVPQIQPQTRPIPATVPMFRDPVPQTKRVESEVPPSWRDDSGSSPVFFEPEKPDRSGFNRVIWIVAAIGTALVIFAGGYSQGWWFGSSSVLPDTSLAMEGTMIDSDSLLALNTLGADSTANENEEPEEEPEEEDEEEETPEDPTAEETTETTETVTDPITGETVTTVTTTAPPEVVPPPPPPREFTPAAQIAYRELTRTNQRYNTLKLRFVQSGVGEDERSQLLGYIDQLESLGREVLAKMPPVAQEAEIQTLLRTLARDRKQFK